jgi:hypothetical protein
MGIWYRVTDAIDCALTDAIHSGKSTREANAFARTVRPHKTYYTIVTHRSPRGGTYELIHEHIASPQFTGPPMFGHKSAAGLWLTEGPVYSERPPGLQTIREETEANQKQVGPQIKGHLSDYS